MVQIEALTPEQALAQQRVTLQVDASGCILQASEAPQALFGFKPAALVGRSLASCVDVLRSQQGQELQAGLRALAARWVERPNRVADCFAACHFIAAAAAAHWRLPPPCAGPSSSGAWPTRWGCIRHSSRAASSLAMQQRCWPSRQGQPCCRWATSPPARAPNASALQSSLGSTSRSAPCPLLQVAVHAAGGEDDDYNEAELAAAAAGTVLTIHLWRADAMAGERCSWSEPGKDVDALSNPQRTAVTLS